MLDEEIVAAFTLASAAAPNWATDAANVWQAVEAVELWKDASVLPAMPALPIDGEMTVTLRTPDAGLALKPDASRTARPSM